MSRFCVCGHIKDYHDAHLIADPTVTGLCSMWNCGCEAFQTRPADWSDDPPNQETR